MENTQKTLRSPLVSQDLKKQDQLSNESGKQWSETEVWFFKGDVSDYIFLLPVLFRTR